MAVEIIASLAFDPGGGDASASVAWPTSLVDVCTPPESLTAILRTVSWAWVPGDVVVLDDAGAVDAAVDVTFAPPSVVVSDGGLDAEFVDDESEGAVVSSARATPIP
jgi:hypothetical protein